MRHTAVNNQEVNFYFRRKSKTDRHFSANSKSFSKFVFQQLEIILILGPLLWPKNPNLKKIAYQKVYCNLQSQRKVVGTLELYLYPPSPLINVGNYRVFFQQKGKDLSDYQHWEWGKGELVSCPNSFFWDCLKENLKNVTPLALTKLRKEGSCNLSRVKLTSAAKTKQHTVPSFTWVGTKERKVMFLNDLLRQVTA